MRIKDECWNPSGRGLEDSTPRPSESCEEMAWSFAKDPIEIIATLGQDDLKRFGRAAIPVKRCDDRQ